MRHLVTGGAGFIGSHLVERLLAGRDGADECDEVVVLDDFSGGARDNLPADCSRLHVLHGSVLDRALVARAVAGVDRVWHLAAVVGVPRVLGAPLAAMRVNAGGAESVLDACADARVPAVVFSSSEVYGDRDDVRLGEHDVLEPGRTDRVRGSYACAKALAEWYALAHARESGLATLTVRIFNTTGPRQRAAHGMVVPRFVEQALRGGPLTVHGDGRQRRCFIDVRDTVERLIALADEPRAWGQVVNVGGDREIAIRDLAELVRQRVATGIEIAHVPTGEAFPGDEPDIHRRVPDLTRLRGLVGSLPSRPLVDTIDAMLAERRVGGRRAERSVR